MGKTTFDDLKLTEKLKKKNIDPIFIFIDYDLMFFCVEIKYISYS